MHPDLPYQIALTMIPHIGHVLARELLQHFGDARSIFEASPGKLRNVEGLGEFRIRAIRCFNLMPKAEEECKFVENNKINVLFMGQPEYPRRLFNCTDAPILLYSRGKADLNCSRILSVVGTRLNTDYGRQLTEQLIRDLAAENVLILSGLAFGIDALAHKAALRQQLPTAAVLAHGLDQLYPPQHGALALDMVRHGGALISEFPSGTQPDRHHFPARNRIVAGLSDAVLVVETGEKGGSLITAELANDYNRDVFAFPGRVNDPRSAGCNELIRQNKAVLIRNANDLLQFMNWVEPSTRQHSLQTALFHELSPEEKQILHLLQTAETRPIDELNILSGLSNSVVAAAILSLELKNLIVSLPGKMYRLA